MNKHLRNFKHLHTSYFFLQIKKKKSLANMCLANMCSLFKEHGYMTHKTDTPSTINRSTTYDTISTLTGLNIICISN